MSTTVTTTATGRLLYGYAEEFDIVGSGPRAANLHERIIELDPDQCDRLWESQAKRRVARYEVGPFFRVTDVNGVEWDVASAPCGLGCHCAAVIREVHE